MGDMQERVLQASDNSLEAYQSGVVDIVRSKDWVAEVIDVPQRIVKRNWAAKDKVLEKGDRMSCGNVVVIVEVIIVEDNVPNLKLSVEAGDGYDIKKEPSVDIMVEVKVTL